MLQRKKITVSTLQKMKGYKKLVALTAADFITARLLDESEVDIILVGDSLGTTVLGYDKTVFVTMREMLHHLKAVTRTCPLACVVADMPFGSYHGSIDQAVRNAVRLVREGGADAVKLEGGESLRDTIQSIVKAGVPVMGHIGLLPQSILHEGSYHVYGRNLQEIEALRKDLKAIQEAGAFACVFEYIQSKVAKELTQMTGLPTIGIGAGQGCDGQVLVTSDLLGLEAKLNPRAVRRYAELGKIMKKAFRDFVSDVRHGRFPGKKESF